MRNVLVCTVIFLTIFQTSFGQAYKYIGVTEGLSDRRVLSIQKDKSGFMWFLSYAGIDRYDGKNIKHYRLQSDEGYISFYSERTILKADTTGLVWAVGPEGELFKYHHSIDNFVQMQLPEHVVSAKTLNLIKMTDFNEVWYCHKDYCYIYNQDTRNIQQIEFDHQHKHITSIYQFDKETYYIGSDDGICQVTIRDGKLYSSRCMIPNNVCTLPTIIYVHPATNLLFAGSEISGLTVYDLTTRKIVKSYSFLKDFPITSFQPYGDSLILVPTRGAGVQEYNLQSKKLELGLYSDFQEANKMNGNNIRALYIDAHQRIWMSVYARGITIYDRTLPDYKWYKKYIGNTNSLNDDLVNAVLEDSEGDIWFATNNGISLYRVEEDTWEHLFPWNKSEVESMKNSIFLSLCEISPGKIVTGGFMTGVYHIDKATMKVSLQTPETYIPDKENPTFTNKYIRVIYRDSEGLIWTGGNNYLGCTNSKTREFKYYQINDPATCIVEMSPEMLLIGTGDGIYRLNKGTDEVEKMRLPFASQQINCMYYHPCGDLYIGTTNSGLVILRTDGNYEIYLYNTSALLSNTVNTIVPKNEHEIIVATEQNIALFYNKTKEFVNWTSDQGLIEANFTPRAGIHTSRGTFIFGSNNGAVEWKENMKLPHYKKSEILFDQILMGDEHIPQNILHQINEHVADATNQLVQQGEIPIVSIHISTIDYNSPQYTFFRWKLTGKYEYWNKLEKENWLEFRKLEPGEYLLCVQNVSKENDRVLGEKMLKIIVKPSLWFSKGAILTYLISFCCIFALVFRYMIFRRERKIAAEKDRFLIDTVHGIRTPLMLAKSAMDEVMKQQELPTQSYNYLQMANYSVEKLCIMAMNLLNIEKMRKNKKVYVEYCDVNNIVQRLVKPFLSIVEHDHIRIQFISPKDEEIMAWIDISKIELIFYNLISNLIRQTSPNNVIYLSVYKDKRRWGINVTNCHELISVPLGVIPKKGLNRMNRGEMDAELHLISRLVKRHHGMMHYKVMPPTSYLFEVSFPVTHFYYIKQNGRNESLRDDDDFFSSLPTCPELMPLKELASVEKLGYILLIDEHTEALDFFHNSLGKDWRISTARSAEVALELVAEHEPDIIIASSNVTRMEHGDLCTILKSNVNTSHIPVILITSDDDRDTVQECFSQRADHYVEKPYDLFVIKSILYNILENRQQLHDRLSKVDQVHNLKEIKQANIEQETKFLSTVKEVIRAHVDNPDFGVDELCAQMGMSRTNLYNKIKSLTKSSLSTLIRDARMQRACEMLLSDKYNITEVCDRLGFNELKYFREVFKKYYGVTPSEYIKAHSNEVEKDVDKEE